MARFIRLSFLLIISIATIYGCGSSMSSGGDQTASSDLIVDTAKTVGTETCLTCHIPGNEDFVSAYAKWYNGKHGNMNASPDHSCSSGPCHNPVLEDTDIEMTLPIIDMTTKLLTGYNDVDTAHQPIVGCEGCHGGGQMHATSPTTPLPMAYNESPKNGWSYQYATCTTCHQLTDDNNEWITTETQHLTRRGASRAYRVITDTHYDDPTTTDVVEGYAIDPTSPTSCTACHDPHYVMIDDANDEKDMNSIYVQWASSAHAGELLTVKENEWAASGMTEDNLSFFNVGATDATGAAWTHYDWDAADRQSCQKCHSATGAANFQMKLSEYDAAENDFSHLSGWTSGGSSDQNELLYCSGCHSDTKGGLNVGSATVTDIFKAMPDINSGRFFYEETTDNTSVQAMFNQKIDSIPDIGASKTCITCHVGRTSVMLDVDRKAADGTLDGDGSGSSTHYLDTAGTLFRFAAYEFAGVSYEDVGYFAHNNVGVNDTAGTGTDGPCVTCHMPDTNNMTDHLFAITEDTDNDGTDDAIRSNVLSVCSNCHAGAYEMDFATLHHEKAGFENALEAMKHYTMNNYATAPIGLQDSYPYVYYGPDGSQFNKSDDLWTTDFGANDKDAYGAAYNYVWISHDPGAFAHNRYYAKRVIFDAIDFFDNGVLDGTIDMTGYTDGATWMHSSDPITAVTRP